MLTIVSKRKPYSNDLKFKKKKKKDHLNEHRKSIWKNPTPFYDTNTKNVRIEGNFLNMIGGIYEKPTANFIFNCKILKAFSLRSGTR